MKLARLAIDRPVTALMFYVAIRFLPRFFYHFERFIGEYEGQFEQIMAVSDPGLPEVEDARKRLAGLKGT